MKKLLILLFSLLIPFNSYGEWVHLGDGADEGVNKGFSFYLDNETVKKHDEFVYYWTLTDALVPTVYGDLSWKTYTQGDCDVNRFKTLGRYWYTQPMGKGPTSEINTDLTEWAYTIPESVNYYSLTYACLLAE